MLKLIILIVFTVKYYTTFDLQQFTNINGNQEDLFYKDLKRFGKSVLLLPRTNNIFYNSAAEMGFVIQ